MYRTKRAGKGILRDQTVQRSCGMDRHGKLKGLNKGQCGLTEEGIMERKQWETRLERWLRDFG